MSLKRSTGMLNKLGGIKTNLINNSDFEVDTSGWTANNATLSTVGGQLEIAESGGSEPGQAYVDIDTVPGRVYKLDLDFVKGTSATGRVMAGTTADPDKLLLSPEYADASLDKKHLAFVAEEDTTRITLQSDSAVDGETSYFDNVWLEEIIDGFQELFRGCKIDVYTGAQPASADDAATGTRLYTLTVDGDGTTGLSWEQSSGGVIAKESEESWRGTAVASGTAGWFRVYEQIDDPSAASTLNARWDGAIATSGAEANMSNTSVESGAIQTATAFTYTQPAG